MPTKAALLHVTPMIPSGPSLPEAIRFFTEHLGFTILWQHPGIAGICRDEVEFHLVENNNQVWAENASFSFGVSDLVALYAEYAKAPAKVGPLEVKAWGRQEFHMILPSGVCFQFYQRAENP